MVTENPLAWSNFPREADIIPFPRDEVTPPVTKIYLVDPISSSGWQISTYGVQMYKVFSGFGNSFNNPINHSFKTARKIQKQHK
jgi:hypothetical protein